MPYMYILECADGSYYTGSTWNLEKRLWEHQNGLGANHTKKHLPVKLVYCEPYDRVEDAFHREKQVQGWSRRKKQALIEQNFDKLVEFSKNYTQYGNPASASTSLAPGGSSLASAPFPELVEGNTVISTEPASTSSASALTDKPLPEPVEGSGGVAAQLAEESRLNTLIQENLAKVVLND